MKGQEDGEEDVMSYSSPTQEQKRQVREFYRRKRAQQYC